MKKDARSKERLSHALRYTKGSTKSSEPVMGRAILHYGRLSAPSPFPARAAAPAAAPAVPPAAAPAPGAHAAAGQTPPARHAPRASAPPETSCKAARWKKQARRGWHSGSTKRGSCPASNPCTAWCPHRLDTACCLPFLQQSLANAQQGCASAGTCRVGGGAPPRHCSCGC